MKRRRYVHPLKRHPVDQLMSDTDSYYQASLRAYAELPDDTKKDIDAMVRASAIMLNGDTFDFLKPKP